VQFSLHGSIAIGEYGLRVLSLGMVSAQLGGIDQCDGTCIFVLFSFSGCASIMSFEHLICAGFNPYLHDINIFSFCKK
jgi:hypothetical protein